MGYDRIIKDSDDEEESLPGDPPRMSPPAALPENNMDSAEPQTANLDINFDHFIQSEKAVPAQLSSSQQRREERWIPSGDAGGSIGESDIHSDSSRLLIDARSSYDGV